MDRDVEQGPQIDRIQFDKILRYIEKGKARQEVPTASWVEVVKEVVDTTFSLQSLLVRCSPFSSLRRKRRFQQYQI